MRILVTIAVLARVIKCLADAGENEQHPECADDLREILAALES